MEKKFQCKRCGACCRPRWLVDNGRPITTLERIQEFITGKPTPPRGVWTCWTNWTKWDIERAAAFLGITFGEFVSTYKLADPIAEIAKSNGLTRQELLVHDAGKLRMSIDEMERKQPHYAMYQLYMVKGKEERNCPFITVDMDGKSCCKIYEARPSMCRDFPSYEQLNDKFDFYAGHCPGFERLS